MGYIDEVMSISNEINYARSYHDKGIHKIINKIIYDINVKKLRESINRIRENELSTKLTSEFADYFLDKFLSSNSKYHIKQILKGQYEGAGSITFEFDMPDHYMGMITVNFTNKEATIGNYIYTIFGPNSSLHLTTREDNVMNIGVNEVDISEIGKSGSEKINQLKYIFVTTVTKDIKEFLNSNVGIKEIVNGN